MSWRPARIALLGSVAAMASAWLLLRPARVPERRTAASETALESPGDSDTYEDGTPDFLRLDDEHDREAFRRWFTWLAEAQYFQAPAKRPAEITDCAALIRYAYREALRAHNPGWAEGARVPVVPAFDRVAKYQYPHTPLGASLFRVKEGPYRLGDAGAFAQFADARTLRRYNTHFVSREPARALPGDLLFYRQETGPMPFHSMIYIGAGRVRKDAGRRVIYHTGPGGEMRRLRVEELIRYPQAEWRAIAANPNFLGVYRWNILR